MASKNVANVVKNVVLYAKNQEVKLMPPQTIKRLKLFLFKSPSSLKNFLNEMHYGLFSNNKLDLITVMKLTKKR